MFSPNTVTLWGAGGWDFNIWTLGGQDSVHKRGVMFPLGNIERKYNQSVIHQPVTITWISTEPKLSCNCKGEIDEEIWEINSLWKNIMIKRSGSEKCCYFVISFVVLFDY